MTEDQIIRQVLQGGGNMPAYGNALNPAETTALVRFLTTLRGNDLALPSMPRGNGSLRRATSNHAERTLACTYSISMPPECRAIFEEWSPPLFLTAATSSPPSSTPAAGSPFAELAPISSHWRLAAFLLGLAIIWLSIASPLDGFADALLSAHMVEHLLLMSFVPPLLLLGFPLSRCCAAFPA